MAAYKTVTVRGIIKTSLVPQRELQVPAAGKKVIKLFYFLTPLYAKSSLLLLLVPVDQKVHGQRYSTGRSIFSGYILGKPIGLSTR